MKLSSRHLTLAAIAVASLVVATVVFFVGTAIGLAPMVAAAPMGLIVAVCGLVLFHQSIEIFVLVLFVARATLDRFGTSGSVSASSAVGMLIIVTAIVWIPLRPGRGTHPGSRVQTGLILYTIAAGLSAVVSVRPATSAVEFVRLASAVCVFLLLGRLLQAGASEGRVLAALLASAIVPLLVAAYDLAFAGGLESKGEFDRLASTFSQSNGFSRYLMVVMIIGLASLGVWKSRPVKLLVFAGWCAAGGAMVLTYTRASWIAAAFGIGLVIYTQKKYRMAAGATALIALLLLAPTVGARFADLGGSESGDAEINSANSLEWRLDYWDQVISLASDTPINGIGIGATALLTEEGKAPHSEVVRAYAEMGFVGLLALVAMLYGLVHTAVTAVQRTSGQARVVSVGCLGVAIAFFTVALVANAMSQTALLWYVFALAALTNSLGRRRADTLTWGPFVRTKLVSQWGRESHRPEQILEPIAS